MTAVELTMTDIEQLLARARTAALNDEDDKIIRAMAETLFYLRELAADNETTIQQLRQILSRPGSEKMRDLFEKLNLEPKPSGEAAANAKPASAEKKPGHGR